jgi:hypothetical protein
MIILYLDQNVHKNTIYSGILYQNVINIGKNRSILTNNENHSQI